MVLSISHFIFTCQDIYFVGMTIIFTILAYKHKPIIFKSLLTRHCFSGIDEGMNDERWIRIRMKMIRYGVTFQSIADKFGISRQRVHAIIKHGYPAKGRTKQILNYFYGRLSG